MKNTVKIFLLAGIFFLMGAANPPGEDNTINNSGDYASVFGNNYQEACFFVQNNPQISLQFLKSGISPDFAWAIVFPELIRYNAIKDKLEMATLYTLYISFDANYANFSVGQFQMKPSFARQLETDYYKYRNTLSSTVNFNFDTCETRKARMERIKRLDNTQWQASYLVLFTKIMDKKYPNRAWHSEKEKLRYYATAYNTGYWLTENYINHMQKKKLFYISAFESSSTRYFSYSAIAEDYLSGKFKSFSN